MEGTTRQDPQLPQSEDSAFSDLWAAIKKLVRQAKDAFFDITNIHDGLDQVGTIHSIMSNKKMKGSNVWLLISAIMVASIGLDTNSPAVIIGAMLISPLMSPILGIGLSVGINNRTTLYQSIQHFGIAIVVSLVTSFLYYTFSPLASNIPTSEMAARTAPTFLDVLVAFFGGLAGIVSGSRKEKSNAIPGVAIATALLPPLCVAGYGLAYGNWTVFINSFYLFFINSVFVALATYLIVRFLDFPYKEYVNEKEKKRSTWMITGFVLLVVVPSMFIFSRVIEDLRRQRFVTKYVKGNFQKGYDIQEKISDTSTYKISLRLYWFDTPFSTLDSLKHVENMADRQVKLSIIQSDKSHQAFEILEKSKKQRNEVRQDLQTEQIRRQQLTQELFLVRGELDSLNRRRTILSQTYKEYKNFPNLDKLAFADAEQTTDSTCIRTDYILFQWKKGTAKEKMTEYENIIQMQLQTRFNIDTLYVIRK